MLNSIRTRRFAITPFFLLVLISGILFNCSQAGSKEQKQQTGTLAQSSTLKAAETQPPANVTTSNHQLVVYYFMSTYRCPSCIYIEKTTESVVKNVFADQVKCGRVVFKAINIDAPDTKHYEKDYNLYAQSVILSDINNGKELRWTNLDKVWKLLNNDKAFEAYIAKEIKNYLGES